MARSAFWAPWSPAWVPCAGQQRPLLAAGVVALRRLLGGTTGQPCDCGCAHSRSLHPQRGKDVWPLLQTTTGSLLLYFFFFQETHRAPKTDPTKLHTKSHGLLRTVIFLCFNQIEFFSLQNPVFLQLMGMVGCAWRPSAASLEASCPYFIGLR